MAGANIPVKPKHALPQPGRVEGARSAMDHPIDRLPPLLAHRWMVS